MPHRAAGGRAGCGRLSYGHLHLALSSHPPLSPLCSLGPAPTRLPAMQAYPQAFAQPNKGTLVPGQSITVNKYTVVVERYLSQGQTCCFC